MKNLPRCFVSLFIAAIGLHCTVQAQTWTQVSKTVASDAELYDYYGASVAISGEYAVIGAYRQNFNVTNVNYQEDAGAAYVLKRNANGTWSQVQKIVASDRAANDNFGFSVAISGNYLVVSARYEDHDLAGGNALAIAGSAYIFERTSGNTWVQVQKIVASDRGFQDVFGSAVSISGDRMVVGASNERHDVDGNNEAIGAGSCYVFERNQAGTWEEVQKIVASDRGANDNFGISVSISGDHLVVGAHQNADDEVGANPINFAGAAYIFERNISGVWSEVTKVVSTDRAADEYFGNSVAVAGNYLVVGSYFDDENSLGQDSVYRAGSSFIYERNTTGSWQFVQKIIASDRSSSDQFGRSVTIDGNTIAVGADNDGDAPGSPTVLSGAGSAYIFQRNTLGDWTEVQKKVAGDRAQSDHFGDAIAISDNKLVVGATYKDGPTGTVTTDAGAAYFFLGECVESYATIDPIACEQYTAPDGQEYTSGGTYTAVLENSMGCDSIITINLTIAEIDTTVTVTSSTLSASATNATYQWLDCATNMSIPGATEQSYTADQGNFAVIVSIDGCSDTSNCHVVNTVGLELNSSDTPSALRVQPNPVKDLLVVTIDQRYLSTKELIMLDATGRIVLLQNNPTDRNIMDMSSLANGIYTLQLGEQTIQVLKQ